MNDRQPVVAMVTCGLDSAHVVRWAANEAIMSGSPLMLLAVVTDAGVVAGPAGDSPRQDHDAEILAGALLAKARVQAREQARRSGGRLEIGTRFRRGPLASTLIDQSRDARLIAVGRLGVDPERPGRVGGVRTRLIGQARCPIAYVSRPLGKRSTSPNVSVALRDSRDYHVLDVGCREAAVRGAEAVVLRAPSGGHKDDSDMQKMIEHMTWMWPTVTLREVLIQPGLLTRALIAATEGAELVVVPSQVADVGSRSRSREPFDEEALIHQADCPLLLVNAHENARAAFAQRIRTVLHV